MCILHKNEVLKFETGLSCAPTITFLETMSQSQSTIFVRGIVVKMTILLNYLMSYSISASYIKYYTELVFWRNLCLKIKSPLYTSMSENLIIIYCKIKQISYKMPLLHTSSVPLPRVSFLLISLPGMQLFRLNVGLSLNLATVYYYLMANFFVSLAVSRKRYSRDIEKCYLRT